VHGPAAVEALRPAAAGTAPPTRAAAEAAAAGEVSDGTCGYATGETSGEFVLVQARRRQRSVSRPQRPAAAIAAAPAATAAGPRAQLGAKALLFSATRDDSPAAARLPLSASAACGGLQRKLSSAAAISAAAGVDSPAFGSLPPPDAASPLPLLSALGAALGEVGSVALAEHQRRVPNSQHLLSHARMREQVPRPPLSPIAATPPLTRSSCTAENTSGGAAPSAAERSAHCSRAEDAAAEAMAHAGLAGAADADAPGGAAGTAVSYPALPSRVLPSFSTPRAPGAHAAAAAAAASSAEGLLQRHGSDGDDEGEEPAGGESASEWEMTAGHGVGGAGEGPDAWTRVRYRRTAARRRKRGAASATAASQCDGLEGV
jgi:hypothetical protein